MYAASTRCVRKVVWFASVFLSVALAGNAIAQNTPYPTQTVRILVGGPAGGSADAPARMLATALAAILGKPVIVENRPGAGTMIAAEAAARAKPDGHTLYLTTVANAINQTLIPRPGLDINRDFDHLAQIATAGLILAVPTASPFNSFQSLVKYAREHPGKLSYASTGVGTSAHLAMELLKSKLNLNMVHVPYGSQQLTPDLIANQVQVAFLNQNAATPLIESGKLRALGVSSATRFELLPSVPTLQELGAKDFEVTAWMGISAPKGLDKHVKEIASDAIIRAAQTPEFISGQVLSGVKVKTVPSAEFAAFIREETAKWAAVIKGANITKE